MARGDRSPVLAFYSIRSWPILQLTVVTRRALFGGTMVTVSRRRFWGHDSHTRAVRFIYGGPTR